MTRTERTQRGERPGARGKLIVADLLLAPGQRARPRTDQELLDMKPAKDASPEEWRAWHQMLYDAGWLRPPEPSK